jgi:hypothetical protein
MDPKEAEHRFLSDILSVTGELYEVKAHGKMFLHEYAAGAKFSIEELDLLLMVRMKKERGENVVLYLAKAYAKVEGNILLKHGLVTKESAEEVQQTLLNYLISVSTDPSSFDLENPTTQVKSTAAPQMMMMMGGTGMQPEVITMN